MPHGVQVRRAGFSYITKSPPAGAFSCLSRLRLATTVRLASGNYSDALRLGTSRLFLKRRVHLEKLGDGWGSNHRAHVLEHHAAKARHVGLVDAGGRKGGEESRWTGGDRQLPGARAAHQRVPHHALR